jgi:hypothetical protein
MRASGLRKDFGNLRHSLVRTIVGCIHPNERPQNLGVNFVGVPMIRFVYSLMATAEASCEVAG